MDPLFNNPTKPFKTSLYYYLTFTLEYSFQVQSIEEAQDVGATTADEVVEEGSQVAPGMVDQLLRKLATLLA